MNISDKISSFVVTTERMLDLANSDEWEQVIEIEMQRSIEIKDFFDSLGNDARQNNSLQLQQVIEKILRLDDQISVLANKSKSGAVEAMQKNNSTRKAMSEYQSNTEL